MKKSVLILIVSLIGFLSSYSQTKTIKGTVTASDGLGLPGSSVVVKGTTLGTITDLDGKYELSVPTDASTLVFSFIGMISQEIEIADQSTIDVKLVEDVLGLSEVVVIGYGVQKKSLVTGSIAKIDEEQIVKTPSLRPEQAIQGRTSGVVVSQSSGQPGAGFTVRVRGTGSNQESEPIYIVDGMRMDGIESINTNDIESIEILKDAASAAIYGSQGANGVVLITTKSGKKGEPSLNYRFYYGMQELANKKFGVLNRHDYLDYRWRALTAEGVDTAGIIDPAGSYHLPLPGSEGTNTDWIDKVFSNAPMLEHSININGGNEKSSYVFSGSYFTQDGIAGGDKANFTRYTARYNANHKLKDWFEIGNKFNFIHSVRTSLPENSIFNSFMNRAINMDPLTPTLVDSYSDLPAFVQSQAPDYVVRNADGKYYGISDYVGGEVFNPLAASEVEHGSYKIDKLLSSINADFKPIKGLLYRSKLDLSLAYGMNDYWNPKTYFNLENNNPQNGVGRSVEQWIDWQWGNTVNYDFTIGDNNISVLSGIEARQEHYKGIWSSGRNMVKEDPNFALISTTVDSLSRSSDAINSVNWLSYFGRINYNFQEKYLASLIFRDDGSSLFGPLTRYGYFPSISTGWVVSHENFWNVNFINFFKVRASWGQNGSTSNLEIDQWRSLITEVYQYPNAFGQMEPAAEPEVNSNPNLHWETSEQLDLGIDLAFYENRLTLNADYYRKITRDLLTLATTPYIFGNYITLLNAGDVLNTGIEMEVGAQQKMGDVSIHINLNAAYNYNEVLNTGEEDVLNGPTLFLEDGPITMFRVGYPVWYYSAYVTDGIFQTDEAASNYVNAAGVRYQSSAQAGDVKFVDVNKDGTINSDDRVMIGDPNPDWIMGANLQMEYKNFDLSLFLQGTFGQQVVNAINRSDRFGYNKPQFYYDDAWDGEGSTNEWFRPSEKDLNRNFRNSDLFVNDAGFLRLKNLQIGYNLAGIAFLKGYGIKNARLYASVQNLLTITKYKGMEPEIGAVGGASSVGIDYGFYPQSKIYQFGINVTF